MTDVVILTTDTLPAHMQLVELFGFVQATGQVQISQKGIIDAIIDRKRNEYQEVLDQFVSSAPKGTNVIFAVNISTSVASFSNKTVLCVTYCGTAAHCKMLDEPS